jgi:Periplasmic protease
MTIGRFLRSAAGLLPAGMVFLVLSVSSCKEDNAAPDPDGEITNAEINRWIVDSMRHYYYWTEEIPPDNSLNFNAGPRDFFESLLNRPADRFSWIQNAEELRRESAGIIKTSGLGFAFFRIGDDRAGIAIRYVLEGSPADEAGIERGDVFTRVNGQVIAVDREGYVRNHEPLQGNETFTLTEGILNGNTISEGEEISLTPVEGFQEKAIHMDSVMVADNGTKIGYLFYNRFLNQPQELVDAFQRFKTAGVTELIVDERYNPGGYVEMAGLMSALIHKGFDINSPFIQFDFNSNFTDETLTYADIFGAANEALVSGTNLGLDRVFILATNNSASASELLINNLRPFLGTSNVIHIGSTTVGKDEASITIENSSPRFQGEDDWGIQPIVLKYKNRNGEGDFHDGIIPQYPVSETVPFAPMGSAEDPLIATAMGIIDPGMQALLKRQMDVDKARWPAQAEQLEKANEELIKPRPVDVTDLLKGKTLQLR